MPSNLSAVVITHNAKDTINRCLDALLKVTEDVVVVDSGSHDGTREICLSKPVHYLQKDWEGYAANKNFGGLHTSHDYILSIDSDEILSDELIKSIQQEFAKKELKDAYELNFLSNYCGKWIRFGSWNPEWHIRIFNKTKIKWQVQDVHETLDIMPSHTIASLKGKILHYSYPTVEKHLAKIEHYTTLFAERAFKSGIKSTILKAYASAFYTFLSSYLLKFGFLDGYYGFVIAQNNAWYSYLKYKKLSVKWNLEL
jgi:glycosyltransferase involved in cell wall biosynthesis